MHLLFIRSRPYKPSSSSTFPLFSCFEPAAAFCRQESTFCTLAPKRALLQWDGFLSLFAEQCCTHQMTCSFRIKAICGHLHILPAWLFTWHWSNASAPLPNLFPPPSHLFSITSRSSLFSCYPLVIKRLRLSLAKWFHHHHYYHHHHHHHHHHRRRRPRAHPLLSLLPALNHACCPLLITKCWYHWFCLALQVSASKNCFVRNDERNVSTIADAHCLNLYAFESTAHVHLIFRIPLVCFCFSRSGCVFHWVSSRVHVMNLSWYILRLWSNVSHSISWLQRNSWLSIIVWRWVLNMHTCGI